MKSKSRFFQWVIIAVGIYLAAFLLISLNAPKQFQAPLFDNLGNYEWEITTYSKDANRFFTQGMIMAYGFNHGEAERSFREAIRLDSTCAMAYWGLAYVLGPNYNMDMEEANKEEVLWAINKADSLKEGLRAWERMLIEALQAKYSKSKEKGNTSEDYRAAMQKVYERFPDHPEIITLYAESIMNLHAWDLYEKDSEEPKPWTPEIVGLLYEALKVAPEHPLANHLMIHATEASDNPGQAIRSAKLLASLVPGSGHLVHMPSHVYIRTGDYHLGSLANEEAVKVDSAYITKCNVEGVYPQLYYPHNYHFLAATAALEGRGSRAIEAAFSMSDIIDRNYLGKPGFATTQHYITIPYNTLVKFAQWEKILLLDEPDTTYKYPLAMWHYARGMAYVNKGFLNIAETELGRLKKFKKHPRVRELMIWDINSGSSILQIAENVLAAEIAMKQNDFHNARQYLEAAIEIEDQLNYNEPPDWFFSVRHILGELMIDRGNYEYARKLYQEDLENFPKNGFALNGLYHALIGLRELEQAESIKQKFDEAWKYADVTLKYSRIDPGKRKNLPLKLGFNTPDELLFLAGSACGR